MSGVVATAIDPAGNPVSLEDHQLADAAAAGYKPVSRTEAAQLQQASEDRRYVDENYGTVGTTALGAANGLTLGLGPALAAHAGLIDRGHLEAAQQTGGYTVGDIAGTLAPAFLSGGESVIGKALARATPIGLVGEAGGVAERLVGKLLPEAGLLGDAAGGTIKMAARGATEGALINAAHQASSDIIQNKPLAAQAMLAASAEGALFGGLTGGLLGGATALADAGVSAVGGRVASSAAGAGDEAAVKALKYMGANDSRLAELAHREGIDEGFAMRKQGTTGAIKDYYRITQEGGASLLNEPGELRRVAAQQATKYQATADDAIQQLQANYATQTPSVARVTDRLRQDLTTAYRGTLDQETANTVFKGLKREMGGLKTWDNWAASREQLADRVANTEGKAGAEVQHNVYKTALNAFDSEFRNALDAADPGLAKVFAAAVSQKRLADELVDMTTVAAGKKAGEKSILKLDNSDAATLGFSVFTGASPIIGGAILAGKKVVQHIQRKLEPSIAEYAARSAIGAEAGHATASIGERVSSGVRGFIRGGVRGGLVAESRAAMKDKKLSYTMANYQNALDMADELTSAAHQQKVRETTDALATMGHPDLAQEMAETYGRAVAYVNKNKPKNGSKEMKAGSLTKPAKDAGISTQGYKFMRQLHAMTSPVDAIVGGLERGDISRDAVAAVKYVFPDLHQDIVLRSAQEILAIREEGKYVPADKLALLGVALDAPVDSKLNADYIAEVQKGLQANNAPAPEGNAPPPPQTDISSYQTPLQATV